MPPFPRRKGDAFASSPLFRAWHVPGLLAVVLLLCSCQVIIPQPKEERVNGRVKITYWEKWTGNEAEAIRKVVDAFNAKQDRIYVNLITMSEIDRKALIAIAGGDPPDLVGLWSSGLPSFAEKEALMPLEPFMAKTGMNRDDFTPVFLDILSYRGRLYGLPTTPATTALHWNKRLFREAGLDPDRPPRTLAELDEMAERLTKRDADGHLIQVGFTPAEPGWWPWCWGFWFGGTLFKDDEVTFDCPQNLDAYRWVASYSKRYGVEELRRFQSGFSNNYATPQNAFFSERVAMVLQGVWLSNVINQFAPTLEWAAAPFPSAIPGLDNVTLAECDAIAIPVGARHADEAFEFIRYLCSQEGTEMLCMAQQKFTPLKAVSPDFVAKHPNKYISLFIDLARSPNAFHAPPLSMWFEYSDEVASAFDQLMYGLDTPENACANVQNRVAATWRRARASIERRENAARSATQ